MSGILGKFFLVQDSPPLPCSGRCLYGAFQVPEELWEDFLFPFCSMAESQMSLGQSQEDLISHLKARSDEWRERLCTPSLPREGCRRRGWIKSIPERASPHLALPIPSIQPPNPASRAEFCVPVSFLQLHVGFSVPTNTPGSVGMEAGVSTCFPKSSAQNQSDSCAWKYPSEVLPLPCLDWGLAALPGPWWRSLTPFPTLLPHRMEIMSRRR